MADACKLDIRVFWVFYLHDKYNLVVEKKMSERNMSNNEKFNFQEKDPLPFTYFAVFDGHAGTGAALMAVKLLQEHIQVNLLT